MHEFHMLELSNCAIISKYVIKDVAKEIFPIPSGFKILDTYGNVINGNKNADIESITFIIKLIFNDFLVFCISISSNLFALLLLNRAPPLKWKSLL